MPQSPRIRRRVAAAAVVVAGTAALAGCSAPTEDPASTVPATHRSMVAATEDHLERPAKLAAPLFDRDFYGSEKNPKGTLAVEVAFDEEVGDNSHLMLLMSPAPSRYTTDLCAGPPKGQIERCVEDTTDDGYRRILAWEEASFESDPGIIYAVVDRGESEIVARYSGQEVPETLPGSTLQPLADQLLGLVSDPDVDFRTSQAYAEAGKDIDDAVILDWYGQTNGAPAPPGYDASSS